MAPAAAAAATTTKTTRRSPPLPSLPRRGKGGGGSAACVAVSGRATGPPGALVPSAARFPATAARPHGHPHGGARKKRRRPILRARRALPSFAFNGTAAPPGTSQAGEAFALSLNYYVSARESA